MEEKSKVKETTMWIESIVKDFINQSPENTLRNEANDKAFDDPLVGFSRGDDSIYESYKELVGSLHWTPLEIFNLTFPDLKANADELSVICWILPKTQKIKDDHKKASTMPPESFARAKEFGEKANHKLRKHMFDIFQQKGIEAVVPTLSPLYSVQQSERYVFASTWSEKHAAYASGLGTFGLCGGLITPLGISMRCGSIVARVQTSPTPRPYKSHHDYCLFFTSGVCRSCIERCPAGAVSESGLDKLKCYQYYQKTTEYITSNYGFKGTACGFCQSDVPCESGIPKRPG